MAVVTCSLSVLVAAEPRIITSAFESASAIAAVVIGTVVAAIAYLAMSRWRVPPIVRILVLGTPFLATSFWLISPHFRDTVVQDDVLRLGPLRGNVGNQTYGIPTGYAVTPGPWTVLVWCEALSVESVAATLHVV